LPGIPSTFDGRGFRRFDAPGQVTDIRILPYRAGAHPATKGAFTVLEFDDPEPYSVYLETYAGSTYIKDAPRVSIFQKMSDILVPLSLPIEEYLR
jgi:hypothetical protein